MNLVIKKKEYVAQLGHQRNKTKTKGLAQFCNKLFRKRNSNLNHHKEQKIILNL